MIFTRKCIFFPSKIIGTPQILQASGEAHDPAIAAQDAGEGEAALGKSSIPEAGQAGSGFQIRFNISV